ncbi:MAG: adenylate kinase [Halobacteriovoraceae bacterium]|jgi:adenylate kinase|nr:adenylate kinase [Halobacteriovoraceae bacterium]
MRPNLILLGAPGSGKGTQANRLVSEFGYKHLSTGDLLRAEIAKESDLGQRVKGVLDRGDLVDDNMVLELLKVNCDLENASHIFDGFPRNNEQARMLDEVVLGDSTALAIYFELDLGVLKDRLVNRRTCKDCGVIYNLLFNAPKTEGVCDSCGGTNLEHRKDDNEETVSNRLQVFKDQVEPILAHYEAKGTLRRVDASQKPGEVFTEVEAVLGN